MHEEPWAFVVIQDKQILKKLSESSQADFCQGSASSQFTRTSHSFEHFDRPDFDIFHGANTLIVICAKPLGRLSLRTAGWLRDLMLAACDMGLGSCVIGSSASVLNIRKVKRNSVFRMTTLPSLRSLWGAKGGDSGSLKKGTPDSFLEAEYGIRFAIKRSKQA